MDEGLKSIAGFGWYIDGDIPPGCITAIMEKSISGDVEALDAYFVKYFKENLENLAKSIIMRQNARAKIVIEALECHKEEKYHASTILFLSQSDGICNGQLFTTKNEKKALKKLLDNSEPGSFTKSLYGMITGESAIDVNYSKIGNFHSSLNRHGVVHGRDNNFGTEINSLKALSLLLFITEFVDRYKQL